MKIKPLVTALFLSQLCLTASPLLYASSHDGHGESEQQQAEVEKGPNNGRMLRDGDFAIELAIFEDGVPPEFRVFASKAGKALSAQQLQVSVQLVRLGDVIDDIGFYAEGNYLRGDMEIYEPHSFQVRLTAKYQGQSYSWQYDNFEGRTLIKNAMAKDMGISTGRVQSQQFNESLPVYGKLTQRPDNVRHISARYPGLVKKLYVILGQQVKKGQKLLRIESNDSLQSYTITAPISGVISMQNTNSGELATDQALLTITDNSKLLAELEVFPTNRSKVKIGAQVQISADGVEQQVIGHIKDQRPALTQQQGSVFRVEIDNHDGLFYPGQFIKAHINLDSYSVDKAVRTSGLQSFRDFTVVYAKIGEQYEVRMLELGRKVGPWAEVLGGIDQGVEYVTDNSYLLKADIDKSAASHDH